MGFLEPLNFLVRVLKPAYQYCGSLTGNLIYDIKILQSTSQKVLNPSIENFKGSWNFLNEINFVTLEYTHKRKQTFKNIQIDLAKTSPKIDCFPIFAFSTPFLKEI